MWLEDTLSWPFFDDDHRGFAKGLTAWAGAALPSMPHAKRALAAE